MKYCYRKQRDLFFSFSVPQFDGSVVRSRDDEMFSKSQYSDSAFVYLENGQYSPGLSLTQTYYTYK